MGLFFFFFSPRSSEIREWGVNSLKKFLIFPLRTPLMSLSFYKYIFYFVDFSLSFINLFIIAVGFHHCFLFFLKFSLSQLGCFHSWSLWVFGIWLSHLGFAVLNVIIIVIMIAFIVKEPRKIENTCIIPRLATEKQGERV